MYIILPARVVSHHYCFVANIYLVFNRISPLQIELQVTRVVQYLLRLYEVPVIQQSLSCRPPGPLSTANRATEEKNHSNHSIKWHRGSDRKTPR